MKTYKLLKVALFMLIILVVSCSKPDDSNDTDSDDDGNTPPSSTEKVKYDSAIKNIMTSNCTSCHSGSNPKAGLDLSTYENVKNSVETGPLLTKINASTNFMPPTGKMSTSTRDLIAKWKSDGYLE